MSNTMSKKMSIKDAAVALGVVEKTIQRRIESGKLKAEKVDGKWVVEVVQDTDQTPVKTPHPAEKPPSIEELQHLRSEVKHLRELLLRSDTQIDQLHKLLAKSTNQNDALVAKLPAPRAKLGDRLRPLLAHLRLTSPE